MYKIYKFLFYSTSFKSLQTSRVERKKFKSIYVTFMHLVNSDIYGPHVDLMPFKLVD